jgi:FkbM family methyltransferase
MNGPMESSIGARQELEYCGRPVSAARLSRIRGTVVDIGAHGGDTTLPLAAAVGPEGLVLAFQPGPPWGILKINTWINSPNYRIHAYNFAIDKTNGSGVIIPNAMVAMEGKSSVVRDPAGRFVSWRIVY